MRDNKRIYETFHLIEFLDHHGISYRTSGKNIGVGWIGVEVCPFCSGGGFHFGIHATHKTGSCWICGETCSPFGVVMALLSCQKDEAWREFQQFSSEDISWIPEPDSTGDVVVYPEGMMNTLVGGAVDYLVSRRFRPKDVMQQFKVKSTVYDCWLEVEGRYWNFSERIIAPVYMNRKVQCYVGRDYTEEHEIRYMNSPVVASVTSAHQCVYNYDNLGVNSIFVEGITDVWRLGSKTGAFLGKTFTKEQIGSLAYKDIRKAVVLFDEDAEDRATKLAKALTSVVEQVKVAFLEKGDPADMTEDEALKVKYQLIGEI